MAKLYEFKLKTLQPEGEEIALFLNDPDGNVPICSYIMDIDIFIRMRRHNLITHLENIFNEAHEESHAKELFFDFFNSHKRQYNA